METKKTKKSFYEKANSVLEKLLRKNTHPDFETADWDADQEGVYLSVEYLLENVPGEPVRAVVWYKTPWDCVGGVISKSNINIDLDSPSECKIQITSGAVSEMDWLVNQAYDTFKFVLDKIKEYSDMGLLEGDIE